jgi:hypothetical protein
MVKVNDLVTTSGFLWIVRRVTKKFLHLQEVSHVTLKPKKSKWRKVSPELVRPVQARISW